MSGLVSIEVHQEPSYRVHVGVGALGAAAAFVGSRNAAIVTDARVRALHVGRLGLAAPVVEVPRGEDAKDFATLERVLDAFAHHGLDRSSVVVALGGGAIGDLAGLAASLYMRGIAFVQCPTTLLAQVDASVGGKTAVNLRAGKNLAGAFHPPSAVFADAGVLATLDPDDFLSGLGEVVKSALLDGEEFTAWLEGHAQALLRRDADAVAHVVERCVRLKARLVERDPREHGERKVLNLGHTFAHAIEQATGFGRVPHGVAVGVGVALALRAGENVVLAQRVERLLASLGLVPTLSELRRRIPSGLDGRSLVAAMRLDKKGASGRPRFVVLDAPGAVRWDVELSDERVQRTLA
ncbi:MAG: 3-dehydroquinate synthase [Planctomycetes bacterium]|nr:3-dehydroquinate synthase [Planctomycetota bacterium]